MEDRIKRMRFLLDERQWRLFLANEAMSAEYGGVSKVSRMSGVSRTTIIKGIEEINSGKIVNGRIRRIGGGRNLVENKHPDIEDEIRKLVDGTTYGNPEQVLSYTTESLRRECFSLRVNGMNLQFFGKNNIAA